MRCVLLVVSVVVLLCPVWAEAGQSSLPFLFGPEDHPATGVVGVQSGTLSIQDIARVAQAIGIQFIVMTDRLDSITARGVASYVDACQKATVATGVLMVPGAEIDVGDRRMYSIGPVNSDLVRRIKDCLGKGSNNEVQSQVVRILHADYLAVGIALDDSRTMRLQDVDCVVCNNAAFVPGDLGSAAPIFGADFHGTEFDRLYRWVTIGWPKLLTARHEDIRAEWATLAMAFHADLQEMPVWSVSEKYQGRGGLDPAARIWQGSRCVDNMGQLGVASGLSNAAPLYILSPDSIARVMPGYFAGNVSYAQRETRSSQAERFLEINKLFKKRAEAPIGSPGLARYLDIERIIGGSSPN